MDGHPTTDQKFRLEFIGLDVIRTNLNLPTTTDGWTWSEIDQGGVGGVSGMRIVCGETERGMK